MRTLDFETPENQARILLIRRLLATSSMEERLKFIEQYERAVVNGEIG